MSCSTSRCETLRVRLITGLKSDWGLARQAPRWTKSVVQEIRTSRASHLHIARRLQHKPTIILFIRPDRSILRAQYKPQTLADNRAPNDQQHLPDTPANHAAPEPKHDVVRRTMRIEALSGVRARAGVRNQERTSSLNLERVERLLSESCGEYAERSEGEEE
jgi:hypothetical protein